MGLTGKYDFPGIQKAGTAGIKLALASTTWGAWITSSWLSVAVDPLLGMLTNWLANNGLVIFNLGAILVDGAFDQMNFDNALSDALEKLELGRDKITPEQGKQIDDEIRNAARKFISFATK